MTCIFVTLLSFTYSCFASFVIFVQVSYACVLWIHSIIYPLVVEAKQRSCIFVHFCASLGYMLGRSACLWLCSLHLLRQRRGHYLLSFFIQHFYRSYFLSFIIFHFYHLSSSSFFILSFTFYHCYHSLLLSFFMLIVYHLVFVKSLNIMFCVVSFCHKTL